MTLSPADKTWLQFHGITAIEAERQLKLLTQGVTPPVLERAASLGNGIARLSPIDREHWIHQNLTHDHQIGFFVPASGAASRMFAELRELAVDSERLSKNAAARTFLMSHLVTRCLGRAGIIPRSLTERARALLEPAPQGLGWTCLPKAFLPFHLQGDTIRTALEEQISESCDILWRESRGTLHFTIDDTHLDEAAELCQQSGASAKAAEHHLELMFSAQASSTGTLCLCHGEIARDPDNHPRLRAGGHGSLLGNLGQTPGEVVLIKNIDNIQPGWRRGLTVPWRLALANIALKLRLLGNALLLCAPHSKQETVCTKELSQLLVRLGRPEPEDAAHLRDLVNRPLRVAGMVRNSGAPGGGPFWVAGHGLQIVEQSEIADTPEQQGILHQSTHFNPVDMACCMRRPDGTLYDLSAFANPSRAFISEKTDSDGQKLLALERPGLWNGSMDGWLTILVEIPSETFLPAKTIFDLSHPWRQPPEGNEEF